MRGREENGTKLLPDFSRMNYGEKIEPVERNFGSFPPKYDVGKWQMDNFSVLTLMPFRKCLRPLG